MHIAPAAFSSFEVELQIGISAGNFAQMVQCDPAERRAAQAGVQDYACCVDDPPQRKARNTPHLFHHARGQLAEKVLEARRRVQSLGDLTSRAVQDAANRLEQTSAPMGRTDFGKRRREQELVHRWQGAVQCIARISSVRPRVGLYRHHAPFPRRTIPGLPAITRPITCAGTLAFPRASIRESAWPASTLTSSPPEV